jgi:hypothetical protein
VNARNRELFALIPASLLVTAGFAAVFIQRDELLSDVSLTYGLIFLALCLAAHLVLRMTLPDADRTSSRSSRCSRASASSCSTASTRTSRASRRSGSSSG